MNANLEELKEPLLINDYNPSINQNRDSIFANQEDRGVFGGNESLNSAWQQYILDNQDT